MSVATLTRDQAVGHLRRGFPVIANGMLVEPNRLSDGTKAVPGHFPAGDGTFVATRHDNGHFTRDGLEQIIRSGGSVSHGGVIIDRLEDLPPDAELAAGDVARLEAIREQQQESIRRLQEEQERVNAELERARAATAKAAAEKAAAPAPAAAATQPMEAPKLGTVTPQKATTTTKNAKG